jgi:hypothetical protein
VAELGSSNSESGFFSVLPAPPALAGGLELLAECLLIARELPTGQGALVSDLMAAVQAEVTGAAIQTARAADEAIRHRIALTRVRPRSPSFSGSDAFTGGGGGRKLLEDGIHSESLGLGGVGIASIEELDTVVGKDGRPFWRTQEFGSTHNVGRVVLGFFQPGSVAPDQSQFRRHPIFVAGPGVPMHIQRPIPARHFLRDGAAEAVLFREASFREIEVASVSEIRALRASLL